MRDVTLLHWGMREERNSASDVVDEYCERRRLRGLGFTGDLSRLSAWKADCFILIDAELDRLRRDEAKQKG